MPMLDSIRQVLSNKGKPSIEQEREQMPSHTSATSESAHGSETKTTIAGYEIEGISIAGVQTCIIIPRLKLALDSGRSPTSSSAMGILTMWAASPSMSAREPCWVCRPPSSSSPLLSPPE